MKILLLFILLINSSIVLAKQCKKNQFEFNSLCYNYPNFIDTDKNILKLSNIKEINQKNINILKTNQNYPVFFIIKKELNKESIDDLIIRKGKEIYKDNLNLKFLIFAFALKERQARVLVHPDIKKIYTDEINNEILNEIKKHLVRNDFNSALNEIILLTNLINEEYKKPKNVTKTIPILEKKETPKKTLLEKIKDFFK